MVTFNKDELRKAFTGMHGTLPEVPRGVVVDEVLAFTNSTAHEGSRYIMADPDGVSAPTVPTNGNGLKR
jgi:hypothetical protein